MKRRLWKSIVCMTLILAMVILPICASAASTAYVLKVSGKDVRLRDKSGNIKGLLSRGTKVLYWGEKRDSMFYVYTASGQKGYIYSGYLSSYGAIQRNHIGTITMNTPVYKKSGSKLKKSGSVSTGTMLLVYAFNSNWAKCKTVGGKTVYVPRYAIKQAFKK